VLPPTTTWKTINAFRRHLSPDEVEAIETALIPPDVAAARKSYIELVARQFNELIEGREDTIIPTDPAAKAAFQKFARETAAFGAPPERISLGLVRVWVRLMGRPDRARLGPAVRARLLAQWYLDEEESVYQELRAHRAMIPNAAPPPLNRRRTHPMAYDRLAAEKDHPAAPARDKLSAEAPAGSVVAGPNAGRAAAGPDARTLYQQAMEPRRQQTAEIIAMVAELVGKQESVRVGRIATRPSRGRRRAKTPRLCPGACRGRNQSPEVAVR